MSRVFEEMRQEAAQEAAYREKISIAQQFLAEGDLPEKVARCTGLALDVVMELAGAKTA